MLEMALAYGYCNMLNGGNERDYHYLPGSCGDFFWQIFRWVKFVRILQNGLKPHK
jgi:hypothetical protein